MRGFHSTSVTERWSVEGQDTGSGVSKNGDHSRRTAAIRFYCYSSRQFSAHPKSFRSFCFCLMSSDAKSILGTSPKSSLARINKRTAWAAGNTRYHYNKIGPLDHKMADNCVSLARTNILSSTVSKPIKT